MLRAIQSPIGPVSRNWSRVRVQLGGGYLIAGVLPVLVSLLVQPKLEDASLLQSTLVGALAAVSLGYYLLRNITVFPSMRASYYVMPSFLVSYGLVLTVFFFFRLDYSRSIFISSFLLSLVWFYLAYLQIARGGSLRMGVVPFGAVSSLEEIDRVQWLWLQEPKFDGQNYDALVADFRADLPDEWAGFLADSALTGVVVFHVKQLRESFTGRVEIEHLTENNFGSLVPFMPYLKLRRVADFLLALVLGILLLPFLLIVALLVRLDSPGPALFRQRRVGYRGRTFYVAKFRTMVAVEHDPKERDAAMTKADDQRVTRLGRFLRRSRIDELPQILNILKGEMSWIGPRPEAEILSHWYEQELPFYRYRHIVPPGITGWAQVTQGHVADLESVHSKLHYDFYYIKNFSPWLDILIILRTIRTIFSGFGAK